MKLSANMKFLPIALAAAAFAFVMMGPAEQLHAQPQAKDGKAKAKAGPTRIKTTVVAQGLDHPWSVAWLPNGDMLVTERPGRVRLVHDGVLDPTPISGVPKVHAVRLSGLMEVLPHPNFAENHYVYLTYTKNLKEEGPVVATTLARGKLEGKNLVEVKELLECDSWAGDGGSGSLFSKVDKLVDQNGPKLTETIADLLVEDLGAKGVAVVVEAAHTCMSIRGVRKPGSECVTSSMKGLFRSNVSSRAEVLSLIYGRRST